MANVKFLQGTQASFDALQSKDKGTFYAIVEDNTLKALYLGDVLLSNGAMASAAMAQALTNKDDIDGLQAQIDALTGEDSEGGSLTDKISAIVTANLGDIESLDTTADTIVDAINEVKGTADQAAADATAAKNLANAAAASAMAANQTAEAAQDDIDELKEFIGDDYAEGQTLQQYISATIQASEYDDTEVRGLANAAQSTANAAAASVVALVGDDTGKTVRAIAAEELAAQLIPEAAQESLDTLEEIAAWIQAHPGDVATINADIAALKSAIGEGGSVETQVTTKVEEELEKLSNTASQTGSVDNGYVTLSVTQTNGKVTAVSGSIPSKTYDNYGAASLVQGATTSTVKDLEDTLTWGQIG